MSDGQTRVFVLLLVLAAMEAALQPNVKAVFQGAWYQFQTGLNAGSTPKK